MGSASNVPDRHVSNTKDIEAAVGKVEDILGSIPSEADIRDRLAKVDKIVSTEMAETADIAKMSRDSSE